MATALPLFIVCQNPRCRRVRQVKGPSKQRIQKYCSRRCTSAMTKNLTLGAQQRGAAVSRRVRGAAALARLAGLSVVEAFRRGYTIGWKAGARSARRRLTQMEAPYGDRREKRSVPPQLAGELAPHADSRS